MRCDKKDFFAEVPKDQWKLFGNKVLWKRWAHLFMKTYKCG